MAGFGLDADNEHAWRTALEQVPPNLPVTRYGISVAPSGRSAAVVIGAVGALGRAACASFIAESKRDAAR